MPRSLKMTPPRRFYTRATSFIRPRILACSILTILPISPALQAVTLTFDGGPNSTGTELNLAVNFSSDTLPTTTSEVLFSTVAPAQLTQISSVTYGDLIWNNANSSSITGLISNNTNQTITLSGGGGGTEAVADGGAATDLLLMGSAATSNTLSIGGNAGSGNGQLNLVISKNGNFDVKNSGATLNLTSVVSGEFSLTKTGAGTLVLGGANTFGVSAGNSSTSIFTITAGTVQLSGSGTLGSKLNDLAVNGTLDMNGTSQTVDALSGSGSITNNGTGTSTLTIGNDLGGGTFSGVISDNANAGTGKMALEKIGTGTTTINTAQTYSGATTVSLGYIGNVNGAGGLTLSTSTGRLTNSPVTINGATFTITDSATGTVTRANSVALNNANMPITGTSAGNTVDAITNALNLATGRSTITLTPNSAKNLQLSAGSFTRSTGATTLVRGASLGVNTLANAATTTNSTNVSFGTAPTLSGSGLVSTSTVGILPWAYGDNSATGIGTDFLTYDSTYGLRRLVTSEYVTTFGSGNATLDNAKITTPIGSIDAATALNSLTLGTSGRVNGTGALSVSSGGVLAVDNASIGTLIAGTLSFGSTEGILTAVSTKTLTVGSMITGTGGLTTGGAGTVALTGMNSYTGGTYLSGGVLNVSSDAALGTVPGSAVDNLFFTGGTLQAGAANVGIGSTRNIITSVPTLNATFDSNGNTMAVAGVISGVGGIAKTGLGTLTLSGVSAYTGPTYVSRGILNVTGMLTGTSSFALIGGEADLDFSAATAPTSNIVNSGANLALNIGPLNTAGVNTLTIQGKDGVANTQTFSSTTFSNFASHINLAGGTGGTLAVNLGALNRYTPTTSASTRTNPTGATLDVTIPTGVTVNATSSSTSGGVLIGATVNGNTWATISNSQLVGLSTYSPSLSTANVNVDVPSGGGTLTLNPTTLRFNNPAASTVTLGGTTNNVRDLAAGEVLVTNNVGANLSLITGGVLQGIGRRDIIFIQNNTAGDLQIDSVITDLSGQSSNGLTKSGSGRLILNGANSLNGPAVINEGTVVVAGNYVPSVTLTGTVASGGSTITLDPSSDVSTLFVGEKVTNVTVLDSASASVTYVVTAIDTNAKIVTVSNPATGALTGSFVFSGGGGLGSVTTANSVAPNATLQIGNGGTSGALFNNQGVANNGLLVFNRSDASSFIGVASGMGSLTQAGTGALTLTTANTYTGATTVNAGGTLISGNTSAFGVNSAVTSNGTVQLAGKAMTFGSLAGSGVVENASTAAVTLTLGADNTSTDFSGTLRDGTPASGTAAALTTIKTGTGTQRFSGSVSSSGTVGVGAGALRISGTFTPVVNVGSVASGKAELLIDSGANVAVHVPTLSNAIAAGTSTGAAGGIYQSAGSVSFDGQLVFGSGGGNASGFYSLSGGTLGDDATVLSASNKRFRVAGATTNSTGLFYQSGGAVTLSSNGPGLEIAGNGSTTGITNSFGVGYFTGGTFTAASVNHIAYDGGAGSLVGEQTIAGTAAVTINNVTTIGQAAGDIGTLNLDGGMFATKQIVKGTNGTGYVNFNGGILKAASSATSAFFTGLSAARVFFGGATVDTNSQNVTIGQALLAPTGNGVTSIAIANGGVGFVGAPYIAVSGSSGSGATAVANMVDDGTGNGTYKISSITITNPGVDYSATPSVAISGGGGSGVIVGAVSTGANVAGGLTKIGSGALKIGGANNYTGPTTVSSGTLEISGTIDAASAVTVTSGTLLLSNTTTPINTATALTLGFSGVNSTPANVTLSNSLNNATETFGSLGLNYNSTFDYGTGGGGQDISFTSITRPGGATLTLSNFTSDGTVGNTANDRLFFTTGSASDFVSLFPNQSDVTINSVPGYSAINTPGGGYEIVPVPEPSSIALLGAAGLLGLLGIRQRPRIGRTLVRNLA